MYHTAGVVGQIAFDLITFLATWSCISGLAAGPNTQVSKKSYASDRPELTAPTNEVGSKVGSREGKYVADK